jgi:anti-sigma regulatory factor (Ser/Thr protein kinase)
VEQRLPWSQDAPATARRSVRQFIHNRLPPQRVDDVTVLVSELVANAVRHAPPLEDGTVRLRLQDENDILRVIVEDGGQTFQFEPATFDNATGNAHLGLQLVDRLSDGWGLSLDGKKAVWFEVNLTPEARR